MEEEESSRNMLNVRCLCDGEMDTSNRCVCMHIFGINLGVVSMKNMGVDEIT